MTRVGRSVRWHVALCRPIAVAALLALGASASCGGSPGSEAIEGSTITIAGNDLLEFEPDEIEVPRSGDYTIVFRNAGGLTHTFEIGREGRSTFIAGTEAVAGRTSESIDVGLDTGTYDFVCRYDNHHLAGMVGKLVVR